MRTDNIERRAFRGEHPTVIEFAKTKRTEPVGVAHTNDMTFVHRYNRERSLEARKDRLHRAFECTMVGTFIGVLREFRGEEFSHDITVRTHRAWKHAEFIGEFGGVYEIAIVRDCNGVLADVAIHRLCVVPHA